MERWKGSDGRTTSRARTLTKMLTAWFSNKCNGLIGSDEAVGQVGRCKSSESGVQPEALRARWGEPPRMVESAHSRTQTGILARLQGVRAHFPQYTRKPRRDRSSSQRALHRRASPSPPSACTRPRAKHACADTQEFSVTGAKSVQAFESLSALISIVEFTV